MRAMENQFSDRHPIRRTRAEKRRQLGLLKDRLRTMKSYESPALRESIERKIAELEAFLAERPEHGRRGSGVLASVHSS